MGHAKKKVSTALKVSVFGDFLARIFPHSDWMRRDTPYISVKSTRTPGVRFIDHLIFTKCQKLYYLNENVTFSVITSNNKKSQEINCAKKFAAMSCHGPHGSQKIAMVPM